MSRPSLLLEIGAGALPAPNPPSVVSATWAPAVYVPPPIPVPGSLTGHATADGTRLTWAAVATASPVYAVERAPDSNGAPGAWAEVGRTTAAEYSASLPGATTFWWRVRAVSFGRASAYTAALAVTTRSAVPIQSETAPAGPHTGLQWYQPSARVTRLWNGEQWLPIADRSVRAAGSNLVSNPTFGHNTALTPENSVLSTGAMATDYWLAQTSAYHSIIVEAGNGVRQILIRLRSDVTLPANLPYTSAEVHSSDFFDVMPSRKYRIKGKASCLRNAAPPAGVNVIHRTNIYWYKQDGSFISETPIDFVNTFAENIVIDHELTAPSNAAKAKFLMMAFVNNTAGTAASPGGGLWCDARWFNVGLHLVNNLDTEIEDGTNYGRFGLDDGVMFNGVRRQGMRIPGSNHRPGDLRNQHQLQIGGRTAKVPTSLSYSATAGSPATATISSTAFTMRAGGTNIGYNAASVGVTGTGGSTVRFFLYFDDASYAGGTPALVATTDGNVIYDSLGRLYCGHVDVVFPTSGTSDGSGGGGGPSCVDWNAVLPDGRLVRELQPGDLVPCWNRDPLRPGVEWVPLRSIGFGIEECCTLVTADGRGRITQSVSTPMDLPDGRIVRTPEMLGELALPLDGLVWSPVVAVIPAGVRRVVKPDLGDRMFFAGDTAEQAMATHNNTVKP